jgi:uncharacterized membrane protein YphA (DoxX/SURF4 family)
MSGRRAIGLGLTQAAFAAASAGLALYSLAYGDFTWGAKSALAGLPWREAWVYGSALIMLLASAGLCVPRTALPSVLTIGAYHAVGVLISVPAIVSTPISMETWYPCCESLTPLAAAWILYTVLRSQTPGSGPGGVGSVRLAQVVFGLTCVFYGWSHFVYADYTASMVPGWLPAHVPFAYLTGLGHVAAGIAVSLGFLPRLGATLEALMMSLFGLLVWVPSFFAQPRPKWAGPPQNQWSELVITLVLAASAWVVARSCASRRGRG